MAPPTIATIYSIFIQSLTDATDERGREAWYSREMRLGPLGAENIPIQPVHPVPPGMRFAHAVAAEPFGSPIDFDVRAFPQTSVK